MTVSIVTYHVDLDELRRCLACLDSDVVERIYIIDNSSDTATEALCRDYPNVTYTAQPNRGYGAGHNVALRSVLESSPSTRYHLVLNSDVTFNPGILAELERVMDALPGTGMLQPRIVNPDGSQQWTVRRLPTPLDLFGRRFLPKRLFSRRNSRYELRHLDHSRPFNVAYHQGSFMLLRTDALRRTGLFDERFFMYPEDIDLTRRIHRSYVTLYWPGASVVHDHRAASYKSARMTRIHIVNMLRYFLKYGFFIDRERRRINRLLDSGTTYVQLPEGLLSGHR